MNLLLGVLHHVALTVADLTRSERWYAETLGARVERRTDLDPADRDAGRMPQVWMRVGEVVVNLAQGRPVERAEDQHFVHYALRSNVGSLTQWVRHLEGVGVDVLGPYGHGGLAFVSIYLDDPDGYRWEVIIDYPGFDEARRDALQHGGRLGNPMASYDWD